MELRSFECVVRTYRPDDAPSLALNGNNRRIWENLRDRFPHPFTEEDGRRYIEFNLSNPDNLSFAIDVGGAAVGGISLHPGSDIERIGAEMGYWLGEPFWGRGIITAAIKLLTDFGLNERSFVRIFAVPFTTNVASCRALEKAGYVHEGTMRRSALKNGQIRDQHIYAKVRD